MQEYKVEEREVGILTHLTLELIKYLVCIYLA